MVYTLDPLEDRRWTELVRSHPGASIFHSAEWLDALRRTYGYEPIVYTTSAPGAALANGIPFCRVRSWLTGRRLVSLPFTDHCEPLVSTADDLETLLNALERAVAHERLGCAELRPLSPEGWARQGFGPGASYVLHTLDLRPPLTDIFHAFHKDGVQRKIRRAEREGVTCEIGAGETQLAAFYELMLQTRRRHGLPPQPIDWFRNLVTCLGHRLTIRVARLQGRALASMLTLQGDRVLVYKYGCSESRVHNVGAMPFLFWTAIQAAKADGMLAFDLGRSDLDNEGLATFKDRLGAARQVLAYVRCPPLRSPRRENAGIAGRLRSTVVRHLPRNVLVAAGRLVYRHMA